MAKIGGKVFVKVDGETLLVRGDGFSTNVGQTVMREPVVGADSVHGYTETPVVPFVQFTITEVPAFSMTKLNKIADATVTVELADGRMLMLRNAWHAGELDLNPIAGSSSVRFEGISGEEIA